MCVPVCVRGLDRWFVLTLEIENIYTNMIWGSFSLGRKRIVRMYEMCWTQLEETLFKVDTKNIREILYAETFSALFLCLK